MAGRLYDSYIRIGHGHTCLNRLLIQNVSIYLDSGKLPIQFLCRMGTPIFFSFSFRTAFFLGIIVVLLNYYPARRNLIMLLFCPPPPGLTHLFVMCPWTELFLHYIYLNLSIYLQLEFYHHIHIPKPQQMYP